MTGFLFRCECLTFPRFVLNLYNFRQILILKYLKYYKNALTIITILHVVIFKTSFFLIDKISEFFLYNIFNYFFNLL